MGFFVVVVFLIHHVVFSFAVCSVFVVFQSSRPHESSVNQLPPILAFVFLMACCGHVILQP